MEEPTEESDQQTNKFADRQFIIAITLIGGFFFFLGVSLAYYFWYKDMEILKWLASIFSAWVGTIIGFYFGQRPVEQIKETLKEERQRSDELTNYIKKKTDELWERLERKKND